MKLNLISLVLVNLILIVVSSPNVDFQFRLNAKDHHTDKYKSSSNSLIVRRGQPFYVQITDASIDTTDLDTTDFDIRLQYGKVIIH